MNNDEDIHRTKSGHLFWNTRYIFGDESIIITSVNLSLLDDTGFTPKSEEMFQ